MDATKLSGLSDWCEDWNDSVTFQSLTGISATENINEQHKIRAF